MKRATPLLLLFAVFVLLMEPAEAYRGYRRFRTGEWSSRLGGSYFTTPGNYDSGGKRTDLPSGSTYQLINVNLSSRYVLSSSWSFTGDLDVGHAESKSNGFSRTNSGLTGGRFGVEYATGFEMLDLIPEFSYFFPFNKVSLDQDEAINSEGVAETLFNLNIQSAFDSFVLYGSIGYMMRDEGRSSVAPWLVGFEVPVSSSAIGLRLYGFESVSDDKDKGDLTKETARLATSNRVNGGSLKFYGVNPSVVDSEAYVDFHLTPSFSLGLAGGATFAGANTAAGYHGQASLTYRFVPRPKTRVRKAGQLSLDPYVDKFREDTDDGVDQNLFRPLPKPVPPKPVEPAEEMTVTTRPTDPRRPRPSGEDKRLRKQMDEAEMTIQLKVDKKHKKRRRTRQ